MDLISLTDFIVKSVVKESDLVKVTDISSDSDFISLEVEVSKSDMGRVIGKNGKVINSIRTLIQEASSLRDNKYVKLDVKEN